MDLLAHWTVVAIRPATVTGGQVDGRNQERHEHGGAYSRRGEHLDGGWPHV